MTEFDSGFTYCPKCGEKNSLEHDNCTFCGASLRPGFDGDVKEKTEGANSEAGTGNGENPNSFGGFSFGNTAFIGFDNNELESMKDIGAFVGQNKAFYYYRKFKTMEMTGNKASFNFAAFFFPGFWMIYRKLKMGFLFLALQIISSLAAVVFLLADPWESVGITSKLLYVLLVNLPDLIVWALRIFVGIFGNSMLKKKYDSARSGAGELTGEERSRFLAEKGGTNIVGLVVSLVVTYLLLIIIPSQLPYLLSDYPGFTERIAQIYNETFNV